MDYILRDIPWINDGEKTVEELDNLPHMRFNIKNFTETYNYKLNNFYVFKILDLDKASKTGYYGMCINKEFAKTIQENIDLWKKSQIK